MKPRTAFRRGLVLLISIILAGDSWACMAHADDLTEIIENVRRQETLYQNLDVTMDSSYDIGQRVADDREVDRRKWQIRFISQGDRFRLERTGESHAKASLSNLNRIRAFDGKITRVLEQDAIGNLSSGSVEDGESIRPHLFLIRHTHLAVPLSVYFSGEAAVRAHPQGRLDDSDSMSVGYQGMDEIEGLRCEKVLVVNSSKKANTPHDGRLFWLAIDRNYLPVQQYSYTYRFSKTVPVGIGKVLSMREMKPGIWFPTEVEYRAFNKFKIQEGGEFQLQWQERHLITRVELNPDFPVEFFADVKFKTGMPIYEIEKGKIIRSYRSGEAPVDALK